MIIHTLGPKETDSNAAAQYFVQNILKQSAKIALHPSFEELFTKMEQFGGDFLLIPTAFSSKTLNLSWGQWHYRNLEQLILKDAFIFKLGEMVLLKNRQRSTGIAYTHAALADLLQQYVPQAKIKCTASKYLAYQKYLIDGQFVLTNEKNIKLQSNEKIIKRFSPRMIWAVYQIKENQ